MTMQALGRQDWLKGVNGRFGEDMEAWRHGDRFRQGGTGRYVEFWGVFCLMSGMARIDWGGWGSATHGLDGLGWIEEGIGEDEFRQRKI